MDSLAKNIKLKAANANVSGKISNFLCPLEAGNVLQRACEEILYEALSITLNELKSKNKISHLFLDECDDFVALHTKNYLTYANEVKPTVMSISISMTRRLKISR